MNRAHQKLVLLALMIRGQVCRTDKDMRKVENFEGIMSHLRKLGLEFITTDEIDHGTGPADHPTVAARYQMLPSSIDGARTLLGWLKAAR